MVNNDSYLSYLRPTKQLKLKLSSNRHKIDFVQKSSQINLKSLPSWNSKNLEFTWL